MTNTPHSWDPPTAPTTPPISAGKRWKVPLLLVGGTLVIGAIGALAQPSDETDAANSQHTVVATIAETVSTVDPSVPPTSAEAAGITAPAATQPAASVALAPTTALIPAPIPATTPATMPIVTPAPAPPVVLATYLVSHVVDGDTLDVTDSAGSTVRVRMIGIDTPELDTCGGPAAAQALAGLVAGKQVTLIDGGDGEDADRYGRLLRYVDVDGTDSGLSLIEQGVAIARYDSRDGYGRHDREDAYIATDTAVPDQVCQTVAPLVELPPATAAPQPASPSVHYENCTAVKAAGAAPIRPGDPGWQEKFDRDHDGVGCES